jgi:hypothetical protein
MLLASPLSTRCLARGEAPYRSPQELPRLSQGAFLLTLRGDTVGIILKYAVPIIIYKAEVTP